MMSQKARDSEYEGCWAVYCLMTKLPRDDEFYLEVIRGAWAVCSFMTRRDIVDKNITEWTWKRMKWPGPVGLWSVADGYIEISLPSHSQVSWGTGSSWKVDMVWVHGTSMKKMTDWSYTGYTWGQYSRWQLEECEMESLVASILLLP